MVPETLHFQHNAGGGDDAGLRSTLGGARL